MREKCHAIILLCSSIYEGLNHAHRFLCYLDLLSLKQMFTSQINSELWLLLTTGTISADISLIYGEVSGREDDRVCVREEQTEEGAQRPVV